MSVGVAELSLVVAMLAGILFMAVGGLRVGVRRNLRQLPGFNYARARTTMRSATGRNAAGVLAVWQLAELAVELGILSSSSEPRATSVVAVVVVALLIGFVIALVLVDKEAGFVLAIVGIAASLATTYLERGGDGVVVTIVLGMLLAWMYGFVRGITGR